LTTFTDHRRVISDFRFPIADCSTTEALKTNPTPQGVRDGRQLVRTLPER
jgi:hypothetical protein